MSSNWWMVCAICVVTTSVLSGSWMILALYFHQMARSLAKINQQPLGDPLSP